MRTLLAASIPAPSPTLPGLDELDLDRFWTEYRASAPPLLRVGLRAAVWTLELSPPLLLGRATVFSRLSAADRDRLLQKASGSRLAALRQMLMTVKLIACLAYFDDAEVQALIRGGGRS